LRGWKVIKNPGKRRQRLGNECDINWTVSKCEGQSTGNMTALVRVFNWGWKECVADSKQKRNLCNAGQTVDVDQVDESLKSVVGDMNMNINMTILQVKHNQQSDRRKMI